MLKRKTYLSLFLSLLILFSAAGCELIKKNKDTGIEDTETTVETRDTVNTKESVKGGKQEGTDATKPGKDDNAGKQQNVDLIYKSGKFGFQITFPAAWKGKYKIKEYERGITVYHNSGIEREGVFFSISTFGTEAEWEKWVKEEGEWPYKKLGIKAGVVFVESEPSDAQYDPTTNEHKKPSAEFDKLYKDVGTILKSFKFFK